MFIDFIFFMLMLFACIKGLRKGFIVGIFSVLAFILGLAAALKLSAVVANKLAENVDISGRWLPVLSFVVVFLVVAVLVNLGGRLIQTAFETLMLGWLNRIAGVVLFVLLYCFIYSIFLFYAVQLHILKPGAIAASHVYPWLQPIGPKLINTIGSVIPFFKDIFAQLEHFFEAVSNKIPQ